MNLNVDTAKTVLAVVTQMGTGAITSAIITNNVPVHNRNLITKITVPVAGFMIGGLAAKSTSEYSNRVVDDVVASIRAVREAKDNSKAHSV